MSMVKHLFFQKITFWDVTVLSRFLRFPKLLHPQQIEKQYEGREPETHVQVLSLGLPYWTGATECVFHPFPGNVPGHSSSVWTLTSWVHSHVFLPQPLAFMDISFSSATTPKVLINMYIMDESIPYAWCISQMYFLISFSCIVVLFLQWWHITGMWPSVTLFIIPSIMRDELCVTLVARSSFFLLYSCSVAHLPRGPAVLYRSYHPLLILWSCSCAEVLLLRHFLQ